MSERPLRLAAAIQAELAKLIPERIKDPRVPRAGLLTVTKVEVSRDGRYARVGVSFIGGEDELAGAAVGVLTRSAGYLRGEIGRRLGVRQAPELRFIHDRSGEHAARIDALLRGDD